MKLYSLATQSIDIETPISWKNSLGEIFVYFAGELIEYTDTRVIHHEDDGLCNLREFPLQFDDEELEEIDYTKNI